MNISKKTDSLTIFPIREVDIYVLSKYKSELSNHIKTPWVDFEKFDQVRDRVKLLELAQEVDVPVPKWSLATDWDQPGPAIAKARYSIQEEDTGTFYGGTEFLEAGERPDAGTLERKMRHIPLIQEVIPGDEYGFFALMNEGEYISKFQHKRLRSINYTGGASTFRKSVQSERLEALATRLLEPLEWTGPVMVEFKKDSRDGTFKLMEINPRFWGSLPLAVSSGVDFPFNYYQLAANQVMQEQGEYELGVRSQRSLDEFGYLESILNKDGPSYIDKPSFWRSAYNVFSAFSSSESDYFSWDDPLPFLWYGIETLKKYYQRRVKGFN
jgi:hypothetical protein